MNGPIVFDGGVLGAAPVTGVGRAFLHALTAYTVRAETRIALLLPPGTEAPAGLREVDVVHTPAVAGPLARQVRLPALLRRLGARLLHSPVAAIPLRATCPVVATLHDLPWRAASPLDERAAGRRHRLAARLALAHAAVVVVPSEATRTDALADVTGPRAELVVVPHGVPLPAGPLDPALHDGPLLVLGDDRPRKNLARVARAHARARAACADLPPLERLGPGARYVPEDEKNARLRRARALLMVSLHEGFGLPIVEAFGHGTPVLCSDRKSLPEVAGGAALLVDPEDEAAIAAAIVRIHTDAALRSGLAESGRRRAEALTPDRTAGHWIAIHERLVR